MLQTGKWEYIPAVTECVVKHGLCLLLGSAGDTHKVENRDVLGEGYMRASYVRL